jgi:CDP-diacylglycerol--glycerol-3-phosphate 3-phosphatidyltransferase
MTISNRSRDRVKGTFEPLALAMGRLGLTPDALTLIGFAITVVGAYLLALQLWLLGGLVVFIGGAFDMLDGTLARATGKVSTLGAFMDSVFDKMGEIVVYLGIIAGLASNGIPDGPLIAAAAMGAALMVSYTRAKSEGLGFTSGSGMAAVGVMPREVRLVILSLGLVLAGLLGTQPGDGASCGNLLCTDGARPIGILLVALAIIAIGGLITTIQRILHVRSQSNRTPTIPQAGRPASNGEPKP